MDKTSETKRESGVLDNFSKILEETESWHDEAKMGNYYAEFRYFLEILIKKKQQQNFHQIYVQTVSS